MKTTILPKSISLVVLLLIAFTFQFCKTKQTTVTLKKINKSEVLVSYIKDIRPIMVQKCTPCHFPERGKKELLHTFGKTQEYVMAIIKRVQLPTTHKKFMPFKSKKTPLTKAEIKLFTDWLNQNTPR